MGRTDVRADGSREGEGRSGEDRGGAGADDAVDRALEALRDGEPVCVHDFDDREGETDLIYPAGAVDADAVARLREDAGGLVCVALGAEVADAAELPLLADALDHPAVEDADLAYGDRSSFSLPVNHRETYTGVTDEDRALTIGALGEFARAVAESGDAGGAGSGDAGGAESEDAGGTGSEDADADGATSDPAGAFAERFRVPGHVHVLRAAESGIAERRGHTELGVALARAAGLAPAVVVCEMLDGESGDALPVAAAREYAAGRGVPFVDGERIVAALE